MIDESERADTRMMGIVHGALRSDLLRGFARAYRRRAQARWQPGVQAGRAERAAAR